MLAHRIFISYKSQEYDKAKLLYDALKGWGHQPWLDKFDIPYGVERGNKGWDKAILDGMKASNVVIGLMTNASLQSPNVLDEWGWALSAQRRLLLLQFEQVNEEDILPRYIRIQRIPFYDIKSGLTILERTMGRQSATVPTDMDKSKPQTQPEVTQSEVIEDVTKSVSPDEDEIDTKSKPRTWNLGRLSNSLKDVGKRVSKRTRDEPVARKRLLRKLHSSWIVGVLEMSLVDNEVLELDLAFQPETVLRHADYGDMTLPPSVDIAYIFEDMGMELLILGQPGAGKTTTMLQLARELYLQAQAHDNEPMPVVFNLSSWRGTKTVYFPKLQRTIEEVGIRNPQRLIKRLNEENALDVLYTAEPIQFEEWLIEELEERYEVDSSKALEWLADHKLIVMLDGLDEVDRYARDQFVVAINEFRNRYSGLPLVVCSRAEEYEELSEQLNLRSAIQLQPLSNEQLLTYLEKASYDHLRMKIIEENKLYNLFRTPFLLTVTLFTYKEQNIPNNLSIERILQDYVQHRLKLLHTTRYSNDQIYHYLSWLAYNINERSQYIFYPKDIGPSWLPTRLQNDFTNLIAIAESNEEQNRMLAKRFKIFKEGWVIALVTWGLVGLAGPAGLVGIGGIAIYNLVQRYVNSHTLQIMRQHNLIPEDTEDFLAYVVDLGFVRKVGDGYLFVHRYLLEHFADKAVKIHGELVG